MEENIKVIIEQFVDFLLPELNPYETSVYLYLLRNSFLRDGVTEVRVGKRTIATGHGKPQRGEQTAYHHMSEVLKNLEEKGCIKIGDSNREGTLYIVNLPKDIPLVAEKMVSFLSQNKEEDYFNEPEKRREMFERDKWICQYCGEKVAPENVTLDHFIPQSKGGKHSKENLKTCCFICNSIKSGKTYEDAAPFLLKSIQERKAKSHSP
ncbi:MAG: HNH endonuclease signature motif containing protein [Candidatus Methanoperedens sp.]|nr:HNH endonuclease signature motif containing protein [Candidatus Methanoperedens sp.]